MAPGEPLRPGRVYASNPEAIAAALRGLGIEDVETRLVGDEPDQTQTVLARALEAADVLIAVGGVSVGEHDLVRPTLAALGVEERLWRVAMKPGKPFYFGTKGAKRVYGLPGNPVSALVTFHLLVRPALRAILGLTEAEEETTAPPRQDDYDARTSATSSSVPPSTGDVATPVSAQGSHMQTGLAFADALDSRPGWRRSLAGRRRTRSPSHRSDGSLA